MKMRAGACETLAIEKEMLPLMKILTHMTCSKGGDDWYGVIIGFVCLIALMAMLAIFPAPLVRYG